MSTTITSVPQSLLNTMNGTSSSSSTSSTASTSASTLTGSETASQIQNNFLNLLVTQMQNQNPLSPMDNSQITAQLTGLSTVTGISQLNTSMSSLVSSLQSSQTMAAANLIGKSVVVPGNAITLSSGSGEFGVNLSGAATNVQAVISNSSGQVVDTMNLGSMASGQNAITWNGQTTSGSTAADGQYTFTITATNGSSAVTATPLAVGTVSAVSTSSTSGAQLEIPNIGSVNYSSVLQIL